VRSKGLSDDVLVDHFAAGPRLWRFSYERYVNRVTKDVNDTRTAYHSMFSQPPSRIVAGVAYVEEMQSTVRTVYMYMRASNLSYAA
jgi:hypothetical protein